MKIAIRLAAALTFVLAGATLASAASAQTYLGGEVMLQDEAGFTYWGNPDANAYWGSSSGDTLNDYSSWGSNPDIYNYQELHVVPDAYSDTGNNSGWDSWGTSTWDTPSNDYGYGSDDTSSDLYSW